MRKALSKLCGRVSPSLEDQSDMRAWFRNMTADLAARIERIPRSPPSRQRATVRQPGDIVEYRIRLNKWARLLLSGFIDRNWSRSSNSLGSPGAISTDSSDSYSSHLPSHLEDIYTTALAEHLCSVSTPLLSHDQALLMSLQRSKSLHNAPQESRSPGLHCGLSAFPVELARVIPIIILWKFGSLI